MQSEATVKVGPTAAFLDVYSGVSGPASFGSEGRILASSATGDALLLNETLGTLGVPSGFTSGSISGSATWDGTTISGLGLTPGTYVYTWPSAAPGFALAGGPLGQDGMLTVKIGIPEPATWAMTMLGFAGLGLAGWRAARKSAALAA